MPNRIVQQFELSNGKNVHYVVKQSSRTRRYRFYYNRADSVFIVQVPATASKETAIEFLEMNDKRVQEFVNEVSTRPSLTKRNIEPGLRIRLQDRDDLEYTLVRDDTVDYPKRDHQKRELRVSGIGGFAANVKAYLGEMIVFQVRSRCFDYARKIGVDPEKAIETIEAIDHKSRWADCFPARRRLRFHWKLALVPLRTLEYICAHEVSHFVECNHSARFYAVGERALPGFRLRDNELRRNKFMQELLLLGAL